MAQTYHFTFIDAPLETVWGVIFHEAERQGHVVTMREPDLLIVETEGLYSAYGIRQYPAMEGKTGVYLVVTHDQNAVTALTSAPDLFRALESMPIDVDADVYENAKTHLNEIKEVAQQAAKAPRSNVSTNASSKRSIDPNKSGIPANPRLSFGKGVPVAQLRLVWVIYAASLTGLVPAWGMFLGLALLVLNWFGMGKARQALITAASSLLIGSILILASGVGFQSNIFALFIAQAIVAAGVIFWQVRRQKSAYAQAVESYGRPSGWAFGNIALTLAALVIGGIIGSTWTRVLNNTAIEFHAVVSGDRTYADNRLTLTYPVDWHPTDELDAGCQAQNTTCVLAAAHEQRAQLLILTEDLNVFNILTTLDGFAQQEIANIAPDPSGLADPTTTSLKIEGREAIRYQHRYRSDDLLTRPNMTGTILFVRDGNDLIRIYIFTPTASADVIDPIINSLHFVKYAD